MSVTLTMFFSTGPAWGYHAAATGNEEAVCSRPEVLMCDNFEDRNTGGAGWATHTYKNNGWSTSDTTCQTVSTTTAHDGTKALRHDYLAVVALTNSANSCRGADNGGAGFMASTWANAVRTIYVRWYVKFSANWVYSGIAQKHGFMQAVTTSGTQTDGSTHTFGSLNRGFGPTMGFQGGGSAVVPRGQLLQNINGSQPWVLNTWQCVELRLTANEPAATSNAVLEAWIDGVQHWNYPTTRFQTSSATARFNFVEFSAYWNCWGSIGGTTGCHSDARNAHPDMQRYIDGVVASTARIGCVGAPAAFGPLNVR